MDDEKKRDEERRRLLELLPRRVRNLAGSPLHAAFLGTDWAVAVFRFPSMRVAMPIDREERNQALFYRGLTVAGGSVAFLFVFVLIIAFLEIVHQPWIMSWNSNTPHPEELPTSPETITTTTFSAPSLFASIAVLALLTFTAPTIPQLQNAPKVLDEDGLSIRPSLPQNRFLPPPSSHRAQGGGRQQQPPSQQPLPPSSSSSSSSSSSQHPQNTTSSSTTNSNASPPENPPPAETILSRALLSAWLASNLYLKPHKKP